MNIIQQATISSFKTDELILSDRSGSGNMVLAAASGQSILLLGNTNRLATQTVNYNINISESCAIWLNGTNPVQYTLPNNAPSGMAALFVRTGGQLSISPNTGRFWHSTSGLFQATGATVILATSGAKYGVVCDGNNGWIPILE